MNTNKNALILYVLFSLLMPLTSFAAEKIKSPVNIPGSQKVNAEELIKLVETIPDILIIDSRLKSDRPQGYIEGSINLPDQQTNCTTLGKILKNTNSHVAFYCNGPKCGRSATAVKVALACHYKKIYWFRGGFEEWKNKDYPYIKH